MMKAQIRAFARRCVLDTLGLSARPSKGIHLLNSHLLTMDRELNSDFFDDQLKKLSKKSTIIPFGEAVEIIKCRKAVDHSLIAFSYDDGFAECYSHIAPVLEKYNGFGCFFINPNFTKGDKNYNDSFLKDKVHLPDYKAPMSWDQIRELQKKGHIIGGHTMDHTRISEIRNIEDIHYQIGECKKEIETHTKEVCDYFAFPYGHPERDFNINAVEIAEEYFKYIFSASNWRHYFSYSGRIFNRRHCEPYWKASHINYFLSKKVEY